MTITVTVLAMYGVKSLFKDFSFHFIFHSFFLQKSFNCRRKSKLSWVTAPLRQHWVLAEWLIIGHEQAAV